MTAEPSTCPSGDEKVVLCGLLLQTNARLARSLGLELETECGLSLAWFEVLLQLRTSAEGHLKMSEIAAAIVHSTGGTTRLIDRIEEAGLVARGLCPTDRRAVHVAITDQGNARLDEALSVHLHYLDDRLATRLSDDERAELTRLLTKLNEPV